MLASLEQLLDEVASNMATCLLDVSERQKTHWHVLLTPMMATRWTVDLEDIVRKRSSEVEHCVRSC